MSAKWLIPAKDGGHYEVALIIGWRIFKDDKAIADDFIYLNEWPLAETPQNKLKEIMEIQVSRYLDGK